MESLINYPKFLSNYPCGEDLFEGKSQQKIAENICNIIKTEQSCRIIGIDGGWGSGKSNLVTQIQKNLAKDNYHFFIYDAWGHQEDLQRRSFLEELTEYLAQEKLINDSWKVKLSQLLSKAKKTESKRTPKLSIGVIITGLAILITPLFKSLADKVEKTKTLPYHYWWSFLIISIPLLGVIGLFIYFFCKEVEGSFKAKLKNSFTRLFLEYQNKLEEETKYEMISEEEPTVRKFRNWMNDISSDLKEKKLVLVFDNMDRLPQKKVQELWSSIHVFFSEHSYDNIKVIIPFDREHIQLAFKAENIDKKQYGDDFINKTFNVVYRVSPPILSDWKKYFTTQWKEAFGSDGAVSESSNVLQIFDLLSDEITPRRIIAFINEFVSIKLIVKNSIPNNYIALFILGKHAIIKKPIDEILHPTYLKGLSYLYADDEELPKFIASLFYQVEPDKAIQIVFTDKIKRALNENEAGELGKISSISEFYDVLENAIADVTNYENAILALNKLPEDKIGDKNQAEIIWNSLYKKILPRQKSQISEYQLILLSKISKKDEYLRTILNELVADPAFSAVKYYESINELVKTFGQALSIFQELKETKTNVQDFIEFVKEAKSDYSKYKIKVDRKELNDYLIGLQVSDLKEVDYLPYIKKEYPLITFTAHLEALIKLNTANNDKDIMGILFSRYKESSSEKPLKVKLDDVTVYNLFSKCTEFDDFYYDLITMRIAKLDKFNSSYASSFDNILQNQAEEIIENLYKRIEFYIDYGSILLGLTTFSGYPVYKEIAKKLTAQPFGSSRATVSILVSKFQEICELGEIEPKTLFKRLDGWMSFFSKEITIQNITNIASPFFFKQSMNQNFAVCSHCIKTVTDYLNELTEQAWKESFRNMNSYEIEVSIAIDYKFSTNAFEAIKDVLNEIAQGTYSPQDKTTTQLLLDRFEKQGRNFKATFNTVRDSICRLDTMTVTLFKFLGEWLFKYADMHNNQASLRTIFTADIVKDEECFEIIIAHQEKMPEIINSAKEEAQDFKEIIIDKLSRDQSENVVAFARTIGIEYEKNDGKNAETENG